MELKARTEAPGDTGNDVTVLEGLSISADSKDHSVTTMRAAEFILDGSTGGTITEAVGLRIANNLQANKATTSYGIQIYRDSFDYTADIQLSDGSVINKSGNWGVGISDPTVKLHIVASAAPIGIMNINNISEWSTLDFRREGVEVAACGVSPSGTFGGNAIVLSSFDGSWSNPVVIEQGAATGTFYIKSTGDVGVRTETPEQECEINGNLLVRKSDDNSNIYVVGGTNKNGTLWLTEGGAFGAATGTSLIYDGTANLFHIRTGATGTHTEKLTIVRNSGYIGINETAPETLTEWTGTAPYLTIHNSTHEDSDGGRESKLIFKGEQSGEEETILAQIEVSHDGSSDDQLGKMVCSVNTGAGIAEGLRINSNADVDIVNDLTAGTIQADNGYTGSWTNAESNTVTVVGGVITDVS